jgi:hypothetical protein
MFEGVPNQWTPVLPLTELTDNPTAAELAGERLVLFKDNDDQWHAAARLLTASRRPLVPSGW